MIDVSLEIIDKIIYVSLEIRDKMSDVFGVKFISPERYNISAGK